jgi:hypothetical protein
MLFKSLLLRNTNYVVSTKYVPPVFAIRWGCLTKTRSWYGKEEEEEEEIRKAMNKTYHSSPSRRKMSLGSVGAIGGSASAAR